MKMIYLILIIISAFASCTNGDREYPGHKIYEEMEADSLKVDSVTERLPVDTVVIYGGVSQPASKK